MIVLERRNRCFLANTRLLAGMVSAIVAPIIVLAVAKQTCAQGAAVPIPEHGCDRSISDDARRGGRAGKECRA